MERGERFCSIAAMHESRCAMEHDNPREIDGLIHELLISLDDESLQAVGSSIESLVRRHFGSCKECDRRHNNALEAYRRSLPAEKQARLEQAAILLAGKITEEFNEKKHIRYAVDASIAQGKVAPAMEAFDKILKRHRIQIGRAACSERA